MQEEEKQSLFESEAALEKAVLTKLLHLNAMVLGLVTGFVFGCGIFIATNFLIIKGGNVVGPHLALLSQFFYGYQVTFWGSLIGLGYGLITGFITGYAVGRIYNWLADLRSNRRMKRA